MKVLFLDIDGVLNKNYLDEGDTREDRYFHKTLMKNLQYIIEKTDAKIVLSSTWRYGIENEDNKMYTLLKETFKKYEIDIFSTTPIIKCSPRGDEVLVWLAENQDLEIESMAILDDGRDFKGLKDYLIQTSFDAGLTKEKADCVVDLLNSNKYKDENFCKYRNLHINVEGKYDICNRCGSKSISHTVMKPSVMVRHCKELSQDSYRLVEITDCGFNKLLSTEELGSLEDRISMLLRLLNRGVNRNTSTHFPGERIS